MAWFAAAVGGSAALGLLGGWIWGEGPPGAAAGDQHGDGRADERGDARLLVADVWFAGIAVVAGLVTGILGYRFGESRQSGGTRAVITAGLILGGVAGAYVMLWLGERIGLSAYNQAARVQRQRHRVRGVARARRPQRAGVLVAVTAIVILVGEWGARPARWKTRASKPTTAIPNGRGHSPNRSSGNSLCQVPRATSAPNHAMRPAGPTSSGPGARPGSPQPLAGPGRPGQRPATHLG